MSKKNIAEYKIALRKLKASVFGHYKDIQQECGFSIPYISDVLNGEYVNEKILKAAKKVQKKIEKEKADLTKFIS